MVLRFIKRSTIDDTLSYSKVFAAKFSLNQPVHGTW